MVFPFPGGPYNNIPVSGALIPLNSPGLSWGYTIFSIKACFTEVNPYISFHVTPGPVSKMVYIITSTIFWSSFASSRFRVSRSIFCCDRSYDCGYAIGAGSGFLPMNGILFASFDPIPTALLKASLGGYYFTAIYWFGLWFPGAY